jgi:hypothetical protein
MNVICCVCKLNFESKTSGSKYCSNKCWNASHLRTCAFCKKEFVSKDIRKCCSRKCGSSMPKKPGCKISKCLFCGNEFDNGYERRRKFCNKFCSGKYYAKDRRNANWTKIKAKERFTGVDSIWYLNSIPRKRVLVNLKIGCSRCGWSEDMCDLHHIYGRKIPNANSHDNLSYLCPNCHRLADKKKIKPETIIPFSKQVGERWRDVYDTN